ncbi:MAG: hypothetical protein R3B49_03175 [Phycisphaerales bacterium]
MRQHGLVAFALAAGSFGSPTIAAPVLFENFNDNQLDPALWCVFEDHPSVLRVVEANQRLEVRSLGNPGVEATAVIYNCGWALDATQNFKWKVDFHVTDVGAFPGEAAVVAICWFQGSPEPDGGPMFTAVSASVGQNANLSFLGSIHFVNGVRVEEHFLSPTPLLEGTVYYAYAANTDTLTVSTEGYNGADAVAYTGLRADSGSNLAGVALGGSLLGPSPRSRAARRGVTNSRSPPASSSRTLPAPPTSPPTAS